MTYMGPCLCHSPGGAADDEMVVLKGLRKVRLGRHFGAFSTCFQWILIDFHAFFASFAFFLHFLLL